MFENELNEIMFVMCVSCTKEIIIIIIIIIIITIYLLVCECSKARGGPVILVTGRRLFLGQLHQQHHRRHDYDCHHHWHLIVILGTGMIITGMDDHLR